MGQLTYYRLSGLIKISQTRGRLADIGDGHLAQHAKDGCGGFE